MKAESYLQAVWERLRAARYRTKEGVALVNLAADLVAYQSGSLFGQVPEHFFLFARFGELDMTRLGEFVTECHAFGQQNHQQGATAPKSLVVLPVALAEEPDDLAVEEVEWGDRSQLSRLSVVPVPVIVDLRHGQVHYFQETRWLEMAVLSGCRRLIHRFLAMPEPDALESLRGLSVKR